MADGRAVEALYIHVPFCVRKCAYCDFYSIEPRDPRLYATYVEALETELRLAGGATLRTVYIGGGTPTVLPAGDLSRLLAILRRGCDLAGVTEFTVESNPGVIDEERLALLLNAGVNRLSLGVQSLSPPTLKTLGRIHGPAEVHAAVALVRRAGLKNLSLDFIFGVPGQTLEDWRSDLEAALRLEPEHLSIYGLAVAPQTPLGRRLVARELAAADDDLYVDMFESSRERLLRAGYEHYEISNFARPGFRCQHNLVYWRNRPYLGLGPAASSYVGGRRWTNVADLAEYAARLRAGRSPVGESEELLPEMRARETAMLGLRMLDGLEVREFREATGFDPFELFAAPIRLHSQAGRLEVTPKTIRLTPQALPVADSVLADFIS